MRELTDHIVPGDSANHQLKIVVLDQPGQGGANHEYLISGFGGDDGEGMILFQNGPIKEAGVNGITHESLLAILIDRLNGFQSGQYACHDNQEALLCCKQALHLLQKRTRERIARGVEGTHQN